MAKMIGIVGSRRRDSLKDYHAVEVAFRRLYEPGDRIVSGGCPQGGDRFAEIIALELSRPGHWTLEALWAMTRTERWHAIKESGAPILLHKADWNQHGRSAGFKRNNLIARDSEVLIAAVAADRIGGTEDTVKKFLRDKGREQLYLC